MKTPSRSILAATITLILSLSTGLQAVTYSSAIDWTMVYDATVLPNAANSISYSDGTTGSYGTNDSNAPGRLGVEIVDGDVLSFDTTNSGWFILDTDQQDRFFLNSDTGYTVEYRARLLSAYSNTEDENHNSAGVLDMNDGRSDVVAFWSLGFGADVDTDDLFVQLRGGEYITINNDWITYTVTVEDNTVTLYMDGVNVDSTTLQNVNSGTISRWGNLRGSTIGANFEVESLKIYDQGAIAPIPEPGHIGAGIAVLVLSFVLVRRLRR